MYTYRTMLQNVHVDMQEQSDNIKSSKTNTISKTYRNSLRFSSPDSLYSKSAWGYTNNICNLCKNAGVYDKKKKNTVSSLVTVSTNQACQTIKLAAKTQRPEMYA